MSSGSAQTGSSDVGEGFEAVRSRAAISPLDDRAVLRAGGADRGSFLQGMLTNEIAGLEPGQGGYALLLTEQGRVVADLRVYVLEDEIWLEVPAAARDGVRAGLERFIVADDVELEDGAAIGLAVRGPDAARILSDVTGEDVSAWHEGMHRRVHVGGVQARAARISDLGVDAFHLWSDPSDVGDVSAALQDAGAERVEPEALEVQRVVAGVGRLGTEYGLDTLAPEVPSLERAISHEKGCYLGQEVVERIASRGKVNWKIATLWVEAPVSAGDPVKTAEGEVGHVTSVVRRPDDGTTWALARIRAVQSEPGTVLTVVGDGQEYGAEVVPPSPR